MTYTTRTPPSLCMHCGYHMDAATSYQGKVGPKPGDWTVCLRCGGALVFDARLQPVLPAPGAYKALRQTEPALFFVLEQHRAAVLALAKTHPIPNRRRRS